MIRLSKQDKVRHCRRTIGFGRREQWLHARACESSSLLIDTRIEFVNLSTRSLLRSHVPEQGRGPFSIFGVTIGAAVVA